MTAKKVRVCILCKEFKSTKSFRNGAKKCNGCSDYLERDPEYPALKDIWANQKLQKLHWPPTTGLTKQELAYE